IERYISERVYGNVVTMTETGVVHPTVDNWQILILQLFACFSLFSILYASQKLSEDYSNRMRLALLEQEIHGQEEYLREAETRHKQTQAFRHDIKSHLLAMEGLLKGGEAEKAREYLSRLEEISQSLSLLCRTGNTVVDSLLSNKLSAAQQKEIEIECIVKIPSPCAIENLDLCVIFSNAVDNAVKACEQVVTGPRYIRISGKQKGDLFLLEIENSRSAEPSYQKGSGLGLSNIETVAEKYDGAVATETGETWFRLNVLLVIPRHLTDISA
ncbi:MAG: ATP-binding protein, partial [Smithella sp.]